MPDHVLFTLMNAKVSNYVLERFDGKSTNSAKAWCELT